MRCWICNFDSDTGERKLLFEVLGRRIVIPEAGVMTKSTILQGKSKDERISWDGQARVSVGDEVAIDPTTGAIIINGKGEYFYNKYCVGCKYLRVAKEVLNRLTGQYESCGQKSCKGWNEERREEE